MPYLVCSIGRDAILCRVSHLFMAYGRDSHALLCFSLLVSCSLAWLLVSSAVIPVHHYLSPTWPSSARFLLALTV